MCPLIELMAESKDKMPTTSQTLTLLSGRIKNIYKPIKCSLNIFFTASAKTACTVLLHCQGCHPSCLKKKINGVSIPSTQAGDRWATDCVVPQRRQISDGTWVALHLPGREKKTPKRVTMGDEFESSHVNVARHVPRWMEASWRSQLALFVRRSALLYFTTATWLIIWKLFCWRWFCRQLSPLFPRSWAQHVSPNQTPRLPDFQLAKRNSI